MADWLDILVPALDEHDRDGPHSIPLVHESIKAFRDQLAAAFPTGDAPKTYTPQLVVNDADATNGPSQGANPLLGTGSKQWGLYTIRAGWCEGTGVVRCGTSGASFNPDPLRITLPVAVHPDLQLNEGDVGDGVILDYDSPGQFIPSLGPGAWRRVFFHTAPGVIPNDTAGIVLGDNRPLSNALDLYQIWQPSTPITERNLLVPDPGRLAALDSNIGKTSFPTNHTMHVVAGAGGQVNVFGAHYVGRRILLADAHGHTYTGTVKSVVNAGTTAGGLGELDVGEPHGMNLADVTGSFVVSMEGATAAGAFALGGAYENSTRALATLIADLQAMFPAVGSDDVGGTSPFPFGNNDGVFFRLGYPIAPS